MTTFTPLARPSSFRKLATAMWRAPNDPTMNGTMSVEMGPALDYLARLQATSGVRLTVTHLVSRALAVTLARHPELNAKVRFGRIVVRDTVDIFVQVSADGGADLSGTRIDRADTKTVVEIAQSIAERAAAIRSGRDPVLKKSRSLIASLPWFLVRPFILLADFLVNDLEIDLAKSGMPRDPFGSAMVTSVGMFGIDVGYAPFTPIARCPMILLVGEVNLRPWVVDGELAVRRVMNLSASFDHRLIDGYHAGLLARELRALLAAPETLDAPARTPQLPASPTANPVA